MLLKLDLQTHYLNECSIVHLFLIDSIFLMCNGNLHYEIVWTQKNWSISFKPSINSKQSKFAVLPEDKYSRNISKSPRSTRMLTCIKS